MPLPACILAGIFRHECLGMMSVDRPVDLVEEGLYLHHPQRNAGRRGKMIAWGDVSEFEPADDGFSLTLQSAVVERFRGPLQGGLLEEWVQKIPSLMLKAQPPAPVPLSEETESEAGGAEESVLPRVLCAGLLTLRKRKRNDIRYFVLDRDFLSYYTDGDDYLDGAAPRGQVARADVQFVSFAAGGFTIDLESQQVRLGVESPEDLNRWLDAMTAVLDDRVRCELEESQASAVEERCLEDSLAAVVEGTVGIERRGRTTERYMTLEHHGMRLYTDEQAYRNGDFPRVAVQLRDVERLEEQVGRLALHISGQSAPVVVIAPSAHEHGRWRDALNALLLDLVDSSRVVVRVTPADAPAAVVDAAPSPGRDDVSDSAMTIDCVAPSVADVAATDRVPVAPDGAPSSDAAATSGACGVPAAPDEGGAAFAGDVAATGRACGASAAPAVGAAPSVDSVDLVAMAALMPVVAELTEVAEISVGPGAAAGGLEEIAQVAAAQVEDSVGRATTEISSAATIETAEAVTAADVDAVVMPEETTKPAAEVPGAPAAAPAAPPRPCEAQRRPRSHTAPTGSAAPRPAPRGLAAKAGPRRPRVPPSRTVSATSDPARPPSSARGSAATVACFAAQGGAAEDGATCASDGSETASAEAPAEAEAPPAGGDARASGAEGIDAPPPLAEKAATSEAAAEPIPASKLAAHVSSEVAVAEVAAPTRAGPVAEAAGATDAVARKASGENEADTGDEAKLREVFAMCDAQGAGYVTAGRLAEAYRASALTADFFDRLQLASGARAADVVQREAMQDPARQLLWQDMVDTYLRPATSRLLHEGALELVGSRGPLFVQIFADRLCAFEGRMLAGAGEASAILKVLPRDVRAVEVARTGFLLHTHSETMEFRLPPGGVDAESWHRSVSIFAGQPEVEPSPDDATCGAAQRATSSGSLCRSAGGASHAPAARPRRQAGGAQRWELPTYFVQELSSSLLAEWASSGELRHHGALGVASSGALAAKFCVLLEDKLQCFSRPLDVVHGRRPQLTISVADVKSVGRLGQGFLLRTACRSWSFHSRTAVETSAWAQRIEELVGHQQAACARPGCRGGHGAATSSAASLAPRGSRELRPQRPAVSAEPAACAAQREQRLRTAAAGRPWAPPRSRSPPRRRDFLVNTHRAGRQAAALIHGSDRLLVLPSSPCPGGERLRTGWPGKPNEHLPREGASARPTQEKPLVGQRDAYLLHTPRAGCGQTTWDKVNLTTPGSPRGASAEAQYSMQLTPRGPGPREVTGKIGRDNVHTILHQRCCH